MNNINICDKWLKNPLINPETNRKIKENGPKYKQLKKLCVKKEVKEVKKEDKEDKKEVKKEVKEVKKEDKEVKKEVKEVKKEVKEVKKEDNDRIKIFRNINAILSNINKKNQNNNCIKCSTTSNCHIGDFIKIGELISDSSLFGVIYKTYINDDLVSVKIVNDFLIISKKISNNDIYSEIRTLEFLTKYVIKTGFPHFPITYDVLKCERKLLEKYDNIPNEIVKISEKYKKGNILMVMSELADGSLYKFFTKELESNYKNEINKKILLNAFGQIFISLIFFHKVINSFHCDTHEGNFLFRRISPGGYYHYKIFDKDYYIENLGYVWEIWDFGLTNSFTNSETINKERIDDINEPLFSFKYKKPKELIKYFSINSSSKNVIFEYDNIASNNYMIRMFPKNDDSKYLYDFFNEFSSYDFRNKNVSLDPLNISKVDNYVLKIMLKHNLIKDKINHNDIIINKTPYII